MVYRSKPEYPQMSIYSPAILDKSLNAAILHMADRYLPRGYDAAPNAPETLDALKAHLATGSRMLVSSEHSENTIFGDPEINFAFRAWHDACHILGDFAFDLEGETAACELQCSQLLAHYGESARTSRWCQLLRAEIIGQAAYVTRHGVFPKDQVAFDMLYANDPVRALNAQPAFFQS